MSSDNITSRILIGVYLVAIVAMSYFYLQGAENYIDWKITAHAEKEDYSALVFDKGPFQLAIPGSFYTISESFSAGPVERHFTLDGILLFATWLGLCMILALSTLLSRTWFTGVAALFIFLLIRLELSEVSLFGFGYTEKIWSNAILILLFIGPAYLFQSYLKNIAFGYRFLSLTVASVIVLIFGGVDLVTFQEQLTVGLHFSMIVILLIFLLIVAEENVFGILYLITKNRGSSGNEKHFPIFSLFYVGFIGLAYAKKAGMIRMELPFFDPYVLLIISSVVALWSLKYKKELYQQILSESQVNILLTGLGLAVFGYLSLAFSRGNDPIFEGYHYFILYAHLGFGAFFFFYVIVNFVNPLVEGLQIYKIAYKEQNFPYVTARIGGLVAVVAFFLLAGKEPFKLFKAGYYNYAGAQQEVLGESGLAERYYTEASIYGHDNHLSNYKTGYLNLQKDKIKEANYKFGRATLRFPSEQSYVNQAATYGMLGEVTPAIVSLQEGLKRFPNSAPMYNNLGLIYTDLENKEQAADYFDQATETGGWSQANLTNLWRIGQGVDARESYEIGNAGVKANVLATLLKANEKEGSLKFDTGLLAYPMHKSAYLINSVGYFGNGEAVSRLQATLSTPQNEEIYGVAQNTLAVGKYKLGYVSDALRQLDEMAYHANPKEQATCFDKMGLMSLNEQAIELAIGFFERASALDTTMPPVNLAVAYFEARQFEDGLGLLDKLGSPELQPLIDELKIVFNADRGQLNEDQAALRAYYLYEEYSLAELSLVLNGKGEKYVSGLWNKILKEQGQQQNYEAIKGYISLFQPLLSKQEIYEGIALVSLMEGQKYEGETALAKLMLSDDTLKSQGMYQLANRNALDAGFVLAVANYLSEVDPQKAYDLLVHAIDINNKNVALLKAYVLAAVSINLSDYAKPILERLSSLMTPSAYDSFYGEYAKALEQSNAEGW
ncbi:hypothetical protein [Marinoscillum sp. MHG1-6]|uniref:tetratricopeptide repeat protein n=1 Tax=Marinoscillum sp. MHG1-6 TaxID=2959627 RepID=UPI002157A7DC|nr:hypothetical protein [Marinoscillum sp. MHG1-6]